MGTLSIWLLWPYFELVFLKIDMTGVAFGTRHAHPSVGHELTFTIAEDACHSICLFVVVCTFNCWNLCSFTLFKSVLHSGSGPWSLSYPIHHQYFYQMLALVLGNVRKLSVLMIQTLNVGNSTIHDYLHYI